jgi:hypothetical protein
MDGSRRIEGIICQADEQGMEVILMRPLTSGAFERLMVEAFPQIGVLGVGCLLLNHVFSGPYVDVALVGGHVPRPHESWFVSRRQSLAPEITGNAASRIGRVKPHDRKVRWPSQRPGCSIEVRLARKQCRAERWRKR